jgi:hypothetical protein
MLVNCFKFSAKELNVMFTLENIESAGGFSLDMVQLRNAFVKKFPSKKPPALSMFSKANITFSSLAENLKQFTNI